jgi:predicted proteasome-type protease
MAVPCPPLRSGPSGDASLLIAALGPSQDRGSNEDGVTNMAAAYAITEYDRNGRRIATLISPAHLDTVRAVAQQILNHDQAVAFIEIAHLDEKFTPITAHVEEVLPLLPWD